MLFLYLLLFIFSFFVKQKEIEQIDLKPKIDSLTEIINKKDIEYKELSDSLNLDSKTREKNIELINIIKKTIKN